MEKENTQQPESCAVSKKEGGEAELQSSLELRLKELFLSEIV